MIGSGLKMDPRREAAARQRVRVRSIATVHAVATVKIDRGRQYTNTSSRRNRKIQSQTRAVNGIAALVTTPLRSLVTRAPSGQAIPAPGVRLSHRLHAEACTAFVQTRSDPTEICLPYSNLILKRLIPVAATDFQAVTSLT